MADCSFRRRRYYGQVFSGRWTVAFLKDGLAPFYCQTLIHNWFIVKIPEVTGAMPMHGTGAHFWSIAVEEQFYLVAPLLLLVLIPLRHSIPAWSLLTAAAIADQGFYGSISAGVLAAMLQRRRRDWHLRPAGTALLTAVLLIVGWAGWTGILEYGHAVPVVAATIVLLAARPGHRGPVGVFAGGIGYPMYLHHWTGLFVANILFGLLPQMGRPPAVAGGFLFALAFASAAYLVIDQRVLRRRGAFYTPALDRAAMVSACSMMALGILLGTVVIGPLDGGPTP